MRCDTSDPKMATSPVVTCDSASFLMADQTCAWNGSSFSKPNCRSEPAAMPRAICAASMAMVPLPQQGSYSGCAATAPVSGFHQPLAASMAAGQGFLQRGIALSWRQPRLNSGSPRGVDVERAAVGGQVGEHAAVGPGSRLLGRTPWALARKRSAMGVLDAQGWAKFRLCSGLCWAVGLDLEGLLRGEPDLPGHAAGDGVEVVFCCGRAHGPARPARAAPGGCAG
jgi:hypothetical protein